MPSKLVDVVADITIDPTEVVTVRETPAANVSNSTPVERGDMGREFNVGPTIMEVDRVVSSLEETTPPERECEPPVRLSRQQEKALLTGPRFESGSVSNKDSAFRDPNFAYALACGLQNPGD